MFPLSLVSCIKNSLNNCRNIFAKNSPSFDYAQGMLFQKPALSPSRGRVKILQRKSPFEKGGTKGDLTAIWLCHSFHFLNELLGQDITLDSPNTRPFDSVHCPSTACWAYCNPL